MKTMNKILPGHKYVANFMDAPVRIGMVYRMDDKQFIPAIHFNDAYPDINLDQWMDNGSPGDIRFTEARTVQLLFGGSATSDLGETEVGMTIKKARSVAGVIKDAVVQNLRHENVLPELRQLWSSRGFDRYPADYIFVYEVVTAASGTLIYSEDRNNHIVLRHKLGQKVVKALDLASGEFDYVSNTKRTLEIIRNVAHKPLFKAFRFRKNGKIEILG